MPYTPPTGNQVPFGFLPGTYTPPAGNQVGFPFGVPPGNLAPFGWDSSAFGTADVESTNRTVSPSGWNSGVVSGNLVIRGSLLPQGIQPGLVGNPTIINVNRSVLPNGFLSSAFGATKIFNANQYVDLTTRGVAPGSFGTAVMGRDLMFLNPTGITSYALGTPRISFALQSLTASGIVPGIFGNHRVGIPQTLPDIGNVFDDGYGTPTVTAAALQVNGAGAGDQSLYGQPEIHLYTRYVGAFNANQGEEFGLQKIELYIRYLNVGQFANNADPAGYGTAFIENKNKVLVTTGNVMSRYGIPNVFNNAYQLVAAPFGGEAFGSHHIAYYIQFLQPQGWDDSFITSNHHIWANRQWLYPNGVQSAEAFGVSVVINKNQTTKQIFPYEGETFGTAWASFSPRGFGPIGIPYPPAALPDIRFNPYPVSPVGWEEFAPGGTYLTVHQNIAKPASIFPLDTYVSPNAVVENRNKTLVPYGPDDSIIGFHKVDLYVRYVQAQGWENVTWGLHNISYRTKTILANGTSPPTFPVTHRVKNSIPDPPAQQYILVGGYASNLEPAGYGRPLTNIWSIYCSGFTDESVPSPVATNMGIICQGWFSGDLGFGTPFIPYTQYVDLAGRSIIPAASYLSQDSFGFGRVDPHNIWAPSEAPSVQAQNNNGGRGELIALPGTDPTIYYVSGWPWFGLTTVSNQYRFVFPNGAGAGAMGQLHTIYNKTGYVYPQGLNSLKMGSIRFLNTPQYVNMDDTFYVFPGTSFGQASVGFPVPFDPNIRPVGYAAGTFGLTNIDLLNRTRALPSLGVQTLWGMGMVGTRRWFDFQGWDSSAYGNTTRVEYRIRHVYPEGDDMLLMKPDPLGFGDRMKVTGNGQVFIPSIQAGERFGAGDWVTGDQRSINQGGFSIIQLKIGDPRVGRGVRPVGWEDTVFGDVQRYVPGTISVQGGDMAAYGKAVVQSVVAPPGWGSFQPGIPSMGRAIYTTGMPPVGFEGPTLTDEYGCSQRYFVMLPIIPGSVGQPTVTA